MCKFRIKTDEYRHLDNGFTLRANDLIYIKNINDAYSIQIVEGTSSRSPSMPVEPIDCAYIIGYILIDPCYKVSGVKQAKVIFTDNTVYRRNLYTSGDDNTLYICGIPFKDLQIIHMEEPIDPEIAEDGEIQ